MPLSMPSLQKIGTDLAVKLVIYSALFKNLAKHSLNQLIKEGVKITVIGQRAELPHATREAIQMAENKTAKLSEPKLHLYVAFNYGGRAEIVRAARNIAQKVASGEITAQDVCEKLVTEHLYTGFMPDPDLVIRTSGEMRLSNFLPWQTAYSEFVSIPENWPDFDEDNLNSAIAEYHVRARRIGK